MGFSDNQQDSRWELVSKPGQFSRDSWELPYTGHNSPNVIKETNENMKFYFFISYVTCTTSFDLWMFDVKHNIFWTMIVNFFNDSLEFIKFHYGNI